MNSQNMPINQQQWRMVGYKDTSDVAEKAAENCFKTKNTKSKATF